MTIKIPDATPEIIRKNAKYDEQALLAKVRYNRLIDISSESPRTRSRATYARRSKRWGRSKSTRFTGVNSNGQQYVIPVQAKGGKDQTRSPKRTKTFATARRNIRTDLPSGLGQFMGDDRIAMFELMIDDDEIKVVREKHYKLVAASDISDKDLSVYARME
ncbi:hypothetical protein [Salinicola tamaricis]|uniref:hypothetical protein n=1 Tax=Salinicola tamaricis TaxID=1771309 RepID=UPI001A936008|nr:hypothetical protein [Salinicola tamaricis]